MILPPLVRQRIEARGAEVVSDGGQRKVSVARQRGVSDVARNKAAKIEVENVSHPGRVRNVDAGMYEAMKRAYLKVVPKTPPGSHWRKFETVWLPTCPKTYFRKEPKQVGGRKPFSSIWKRKVSLRARKPGQSVCTAYHPDSHASLEDSAIVLASEPSADRC